MKMFTHNWCSVLSTLLLGLIASSISMSVLADSAADYANSTGPLHCVNCHGSPGTGLLSVSQLNTDYPTNGPTSDPAKAGIAGGIGLAAYITAAMPKDAKGNCNATCGQAMAHYLRPLAPVADASNTTNKSGVAPLATSFNASKSNCDNGCTSYVWNFGDGKPNGSGVTTSHSYASGTYTATLTVTDAQGLTNSTSVTITASTASTPPVANASKSSNLSGAAPLTAHFDASASSCPNGCTQFDSYQWAVSVGPTLSGKTADYSTNTVGTRSVVLTVRDDTGLKSSVTFNVVVSASTNPPVAKIDPIASNVKGAIPLSATFDASKSVCDDGCSTYVWNFGDGSATETDTSASTGHSYAKAGTYTVTLTVTDAANGKKSSTSIQVIATPSESLASYVQACQSQLNFTNIPIPNLNCFDGDLFDTRTPKNDYLVYKKITDQVDVAVACRWVSGDRSTGTGVSAEMLVYNRQYNNACFFSAKLLPPDKGIAVPVNILSPTDPAASTFWEDPAVVDASVRCIGCHIEGPYIATPLIAPYLAKDGLLNNGHDTGSAIVSGDLTGTFNKAHVKFHAISALVNNVPGAFSQWDNLKQSYMDPVESGCALGCHVVGTLSPQPNKDIAPAGNVLFNPHAQLQEIDDALVMAPYDDASDYRSINLAIPDGGTENETFSTAKNASSTLVPTLLSNCAAPSMMYAHVVGSDNQFVVSQPGRLTFVPDRLSVFNLKDGLQCYNSDQDAGQPICQDYTVQYECTNNTTKVKTWTNLPNRARQSDGDHEPRPSNVCGSGSTATGIQAFFTLSNGWTYSAIGPNDRLAAMSQYGITCNKSDQPDNSCSNYVVSYHNCGTAPAVQTSKTLTNENTVAGSKQLTAASSSLVKGQGHNNSWNTQVWNIEPIANTEYVRIKSTNTGVYLNVSSQAESTTVGTASLNTSWTSEMWLIETVANSSYVRLKNLWTGKYLTMADPNTVDAGSKDYLPVYSQSRNTGWNTQRWLIQ